MRALICFSLLSVALTRFPHANRSPLRSKTLSLVLTRFPYANSTSLQTDLSVARHRRGEVGHVAFRALVENLLSFDHVEHGLRDIGGVVADPFDVLGAEHQVNAERDIARIFHHVGQELAEQRGAD